MTYCESIGLKIGDRIRVLGEGRPFPKGSVIELVSDPHGDASPLFSDGNSKAYFNLLTLFGGEGKQWERVTEEEQSIDDLINQLEKVIRKREKHRGKLDKWESETDRLIGELEKAIEKRTRSCCSLNIVVR